MPWVVYAKNEPAPGIPPLLGIQKGRNIFSLNHVAITLLQVESDGAVELLFDPQEKLVGVRKVDKRKLTAIPVRKMNQTEGHTTYLISTRDFTRRWGISTDEARRYVGEMRDDVLTFDLKQQPINGQARPRYGTPESASDADQPASGEGTAGRDTTSDNGDSNIAVADR